MQHTFTGLMKLHENTNALLVNAPEHVTNIVADTGASFELPDDGSYEHIHLFTITMNELAKQFPELKAKLRPGGRLWVSWPKGKKLNTDLSLHEVIKIGYKNGLVESNCIRIDETWAALKFTWPKKGKVYNNSHAKLNNEASLE